jgi:hypothetical protein
MENVSAFCLLPTASCPFQIRDIRVHLWPALPCHPR